MKRVSESKQLKKAFEVAPVVAMLGPRQCGKTTLAKEYFTAQKSPIENYFDLEDPIDLARLAEPMLALSDLTGLIVIDEVQLKPDLFPILRVFVDKSKGKQQFLILGSASRLLIYQSSESLAGRIHYMELKPFQLTEVNDLQKLWLRGGFPLSYLARSEEISFQWRKDYIKTFLEQDIPNLGIKIPASNLRRFWMMLAHYHGQYMNASKIGNSLDLSHNTIKKYLDILTGTFMVRQLMPWHENILKRQVKTPKIYFRDSGIFHALLNVESKSNLVVNPHLGASWEGFALEAIIHKLKVPEEDCYFWSTTSKAELDLLIFKKGKKLGFEIKYSQAPKVTRSMRIALEDLKLDKLFVIYPGDKIFKLADNIECCPLEKLNQLDYQ